MADQQEAIARFVIALQFCDKFARLALAREVFGELEFPPGAQDVSRDFGSASGLDKIKSKLNFNRRIPLAARRIVLAPSRVRGRPLSRRYPGVPRGTASA